MHFERNSQTLVGGIRLGLTSRALRFQRSQTLCVTSGKVLIHVLVPWACSKDYDNSLLLLLDSLVNFDRAFVMNV